MIPMIIILKPRGHEIPDLHPAGNTRVSWPGWGLC